MKKTSEIKNLNTEELILKIKDLKSELFNLRFQLAINQLENPMRIRFVKREIARAQTFLRMKEIESLEKKSSEKALV